MFRQTAEHYLGHPRTPQVWEETFDLPIGKPEHANLEARGSNETEPRRPLSRFVRGCFSTPTFVNTVPLSKRGLLHCYISRFAQTTSKLFREKGGGASSLALHPAIWAIGCV